jgi:hypothetical protein
VAILEEMSQPRPEHGGRGRSLIRPCCRQVRAGSIVSVVRSRPLLLCGLRIVPTVQPGQQAQQPAGTRWKAWV